ncbi:ATP-binding protein [Lentzea sp. NPDC051213]|uniref:ATP-binding protein n=1 Tax=Lentzea sp. NPDC051213 TaxID=3364126 RepID=UPI0037BCDE20
MLSFLRDKELLLVLDNCEQLGEACGLFASEVLSSAPNVRILATSRHTLGVPGESLLTVDPIAVRGIHVVRPEDRGDAVKLFEDRAKAVLPSFEVDAQNHELVTRICTRLDGMPLAVELAAVWVRTLTLRSLLDRLDDRFSLLSRGRPATPSRHQTLRAAVGWSYDLCTPSEARLWAWLSVFAGGFTLDAAEQVGTFPDADGTEDVLDLVASLVDKSILVRDGDSVTTRYRMLEMIRQYGLHELTLLGEETLARQRHLDYFTRMAEEADQEWLGPNQLNIAARTRREHANLRAALEFSLADGTRVTAGATLAANLEYYWVNCGHFGESATWMDRLLRHQLPTDLRLRVLWISVYGATALGYMDKAAATSVDAVALARTHGDPVLLGNALAGQGGSALAQGDYLRAEEIYSECLESYASAGHVSCNVILTYLAKGMAAGFRHQADIAEEMALRAIELAEAHGERCVKSYALYTLALAEWRTERLPAALQHARAGLAIKHQFADILGQALLVELCAWIVGTIGDNPLAATLLGIADRIWFRVGGAPMLDSETWQQPHRECEKQARAALGDKAFTAAFDKGVALMIDLPHAIEFVLGAEATDVRPEAHASVLTRREAQVATLVAEGATNKAIASELQISRRTVEAHVDHILTKLGFSSRTQIAVWIADNRYRPA